LTEYIMVFRKYPKRDVYFLWTIL